MINNQILNILKNYYEGSIFITDKNGKVIFVNKTAAERLGSTIERLENNYVKDLVSSGVYEYSTSLQVLRTKKPYFAKINTVGNDHTYSKSIPVFDSDGNVEFVVTNNMSHSDNKDWNEKIEKEIEENNRLRRELDFLRVHTKRVVIANSPQMKSILNMVNIISPTDSNVVILGDSGTGKDLIARTIHDKSNHSAEAFISVNCAAMPENLLESELFGYEGGAFTGALSKGKIGLFEAAGNGTLFLDEIGEMTLALQSKLLHAIENREIRRIGGLKNIPINCRILCATNVDLQEMVQEKKFREDLYYRLNVFKIELPPLRDRKEDIIPLANNFLNQLNVKYGKQKVLADITISTMLNYNWPGNIRELRNVIERIFVISKNNELIFTPVPTAKYGDSFNSEPSYFEHEQFDSLKSFSDYMENQYIQKILSECDGSVSKAAKQLGIHRSVLYRKLQKYNNQK